MHRQYSNQWKEQPMPQAGSRKLRIETCSGRAFTLIELLVVIGIIALLISILLPALVRARAQANDVACASNIRQIAIALRIYATENHDLLPPIECPDPSGIVTWQVPIWQYVVGRPLPTTDFTGGGSYSYLAHTVFECPVARNSRVHTGTDLDGYSTSNHLQNGYAMNATTFGTNGGSLSTSSNASKWPNTTLLTNESKMMSKVHDPSATMLLIDARADFVEYWDRGQSINAMDVLNDLDEGGIIDARGRHGKLGTSWNVGFFDGSVRLMQFHEIPCPPTDANYIASPLSRFSPNQIISFVPGPAVSLNPLYNADNFKKFWAGRSH